MTKDRLTNVFIEGVFWDGLKVDYFIDDLFDEEYICRHGDREQRKCHEDLERIENVPKLAHNAFE